ncbi:MAG TPA: hypothetical protein VFX79_02690 [Candidatus Saccharimonadales bacterium]|nr:hypothetical protein [Candidatus Saccharimonadales bacterium]
MNSPRKGPEIVNSRPETNDSPTVAGGSDAAGMDTTEPYDPEHLKDVVVGLIKSSPRSRIVMKEIVFALTLRESVSEELYSEIREELSSIQESGHIVHMKRGRFELPQAETPAAESSVLDGDEELEAKMRGAFSDSYHSQPPRKIRTQR